MQQQDRGTASPEDPAKDLKEGLGQIKDAAKEALSGSGEAAGSLAERAKQTVSWAAQAAKDTATYTINTVGQVFGNARDDVLKEAAARREPEQAGAAHTETGGFSRAEQREAAVRAGLNSFVPEAKGDASDRQPGSTEVRGMEVNVREGHGPNTPEDLAHAKERPDLMRGDTLPKVEDGATSHEARVGGQPAGTVGKPPASN